MLYNKLIEIIARDSKQMAAAWKEIMLTSEYAKSYHKIPDEELQRRCQAVYENLGNWLESDFTMIQVGKSYAQLGRQRYQEGIPLCQVQFALHVTKKVLWNHILSEGILNTALEVYQAIDLFIRVQNFFDIASFYIISGYMEEIYSQLDKNFHIKTCDLQHLFPEGSFMLTFSPEDHQPPNEKS